MGWQGHDPEAGGHLRKQQLNPGGRWELVSQMERKSQILKRWWGSPLLCSPPPLAPEMPAREDREVWIWLHHFYLGRSLNPLTVSIFSPAKKELLSTWQELWRLEKRCVKCLACAWHEASPQRIVVSSTSIISVISDRINRMRSLSRYRKWGKCIRPMF